MDTGNTTLRNTGRRRIHLEMTGTNLKIYACVTMVFYTLSMSVVQNGLIRIGQYDTAGLSEAMASDPDLMMLSGWASVFQLIGGLAVPVFAFLLVEGFVHTASYRRYLLTMLGFALVSEVPYDLAMSGALWDLSGQNALFTLVICLIMLYALRLFVGKKGVTYRLAQGIVILAAILWCSILRTGFGLCTVLLTAIYYLAYDQKSVRVLLGCAVSVMYVTGPLSGYALWNYTGERGWNRNKYMFYVFYPLHLLVLGLLAHALPAA